MGSAGRLVIVVAVALTAVGAAPAHGSIGAKPAPPVEVEVGDLARTDVEVFMRVGATDAEIGGVRAAIAQAPGVREFAYLDQDAAYEEFSRIFRDDPDLVANMSPSQLPVSFRVAVTPPIHAHARRLDTTLSFRPGVDDVTRKMTADDRARAKREAARTRACRGNGTNDVEVFLLVAATPDDEARVESALRALPAVADVRFVSRSEAMSRFRCSFASDPELVAHTTADQLPVSYEVTFAPGADARAVVQTIAAIPGVADVTTPDP